MHWNVVSGVNHLALGSCDQRNIGVGGNTFADCATVTSGLATANGS
jgi:hypothetical protein